MRVLYLLKPGQWRVSFRAKLAGAASLVIGLLALSVFVYFPHVQSDSAYRAVAEKAQAISDMTAYSAAPGLYFDDVLAVEEALSVALQNKDVVYLVVADNSGHVVAALDEPAAVEAAYHAPNPRDLSAASVFKTSAPIYKGDTKIGQLYIGLSLAPVHAAIQQSRLAVGGVSIILFGVGVALVLAISAVFTRPLLRITRAVERIDGGNLSIRAEVESHDEVGQLALALNRMVGRLAGAYSDLGHLNAELEQRVADRTRALEESNVDLRAAKEEAEEMSRLKSSFLANMSHEIRTPLTSIIGFSEVLAEDFGGDGSDIVHMIRASSERLLTTLNSVLDLAQLESGSVKIVPSVIDVNEMATSTVSLFRHQAEVKGVELRCVLPPSPAFVRADTGSLTRILNNLVSNAIKFTHEGSVTLSVHVEEGTISIAVADTGVGISEEFLPKLFDEFRQESSGHARLYEGNGLGLAITKRLVDLVGAEIRVESEKGQGSTFIISMMRYHDDEKVPEGGAVQRTARSIPARPRILVVEDAPETRVLVSAMLGARFDLVLAGSYDEALGRATSDTFDALLVDINLGEERTGLDLVRALSELKRCANVPKIACTAYALPGDRERLLDEGFDAYVSKPFTKWQLMETLHEQIARRLRTADNRATGTSA